MSDQERAALISTDIAAVIANNPTHYKAHRLNARAKKRSKDFLGAQAAYATALRLGASDLSFCQQTQKEAAELRLKMDQHRKDEQREKERKDEADFRKYRQMDHWSLLGVSKNATKAQINAGR